MQLPYIQVDQTSAVFLIAANAIKKCCLVLAHGLCAMSLLDLLLRAFLKKGT